RSRCAAPCGTTPARGCRRGTCAAPGQPRRSGELDDLADDLAVLHRVEGLVDVLETDPARDHALEVEPARAPQPDEPVVVAADVGGAVDRAEQLLLHREELERGELDHVLSTAGADDDA